MRKRGKMGEEARRLFGTDGVRGIANQWPMEAPVAYRLGQAAAAVFKDVSGLGRIVIGKDTRLSGYVIESALEAGICSMGMDAMLVGPLPTPGIAFIAQSMRAHGGIMVSASHNPVEYNGIKFFDNLGFKLPDSMELRMERLIFEDSLDGMKAAPNAMGKAYRIDDAGGRYIQRLKGTFPQHLALDGLRIVLDCANGAGYRVAPAVFSELGAEVLATGISPDGLNINVDCGALHPQRMARMVRESGAHVGVALDGDADRVIMCDERGRIVDGDVILAICALHLKSKGSLARDTVVGTHMSNMGLEAALSERGIRLIRTAVGDRYVTEAMRREGLNLGGETSGHIIFLHHTTSGDGALAALRVLSVMLQRKVPLSELAAVCRLYPQELISVKVKETRPFDSMPAVASVIRDAESALAGRGRVLIRYSGTEAIARIMVEGPDGAEVKELAAGIAAALRREIGEGC